MPTVVAGASTSVAEEAKDLKKATQDAPSTTATVAQPVRILHHFCKLMKADVNVA